MKFHVKHLMLPHKGNSPGARGHKKIEYPAGTKVYAIVYGTLMFHSVYLSEQQAMTVANNLEKVTLPDARRHIPLNTLLAWNFKSKFPTRVVRKKE